MAIKANQPIPEWCPLCGGDSIAAAEEYGVGTKYLHGWKGWVACQGCFLATPDMGGDSEDDAKEHAIRFLESTARIPPGQELIRGEAVVSA